MRVYLTDWEDPARAYAEVERVGRWRWEARVLQPTDDGAGLPSGWRGSAAAATRRWGQAAAERAALRLLTRYRAACARELARAATTHTVTGDTP